MRIACEYITANYMKNVTLSAIAEICCLSESHFRFLFKQHTGMTFIHYLNQIRIQAAKQLLLQPDLKVYQIGEMVGLPSQPHFIRVFRDETGKTPTDYRKQMGVG
jgi:two-component system response regulator YesN